MSDPVAGETAVLHPHNSVSGVMETAVEAAREGAADARQAVENALPVVSQFMSRFVYTTCYSLSYGVVFPSVLLARDPQREPVGPWPVGRSPCRNGKGRGLVLRSTGIGSNRVR